VNLIHQPTILQAGYLLTLALGFWLYRTGRPYPVALFNVHKLAALGVGVMAGVQGWRAVGGAALSGGVYALILLTAASVLALFASGALLSAAKPAERPLRFTHAIAAILFTAAGLGAFLL